MKYFRVRNLEKFQHYKDRAPPWIKLHSELLENYEFGHLPDAAKWHLVGIWILASRMDNKVPFDSEWVGLKIGASDSVDLEALLELHFLEPWQEDSQGTIREQWASRYIPQPIRDEVMERDGHECQVCGETQHLEIDHIIPISKGGTGAIENLQVLCMSCNRKKRATHVRSDSRTDATQMRSPEGETEAETKAEKKQGAVNLMDGFEIFWTEYPRKESKKKAAQVWKAHELAKLAAQIIADVKTRKAKHRPWREGYVPHASTYLNGERWNDAVDERGSAQAGPTRRTPAEAAAEKLAAELRAARASAKRYGLKPQMEGEPDDNFIARVNRDMSEKMAGVTS